MFRINRCWFYKVRWNKSDEVGSVSVLIEYGFVILTVERSEEKNWSEVKVGLLTFCLIQWEDEFYGSWILLWGLETKPDLPARPKSRGQKGLSGERERGREWWKTDIIRGKIRNSSSLRVKSPKSDKKGERVVRKKTEKNISHRKTETLESNSQ